MPRPGGESDKLGNQFEAVWTVDAVINVLVGDFKSLTVEALGDESQGVEFHLEKSANSLQFHSVKRQKQGGDWSIAHLCRRDKATGRSILGDLFNKRHAYPDAETRFISSTGANELRELTERANTSTSVSEFKKALVPPLQAKFSKYIVPLCHSNERSAFSALMACEVILRSHQDLIRTVEQRIDELFYLIDRSPLKPDDLRRAIADFAIRNLSRRIDAARIRSFFQENGIGVRDWKTEISVRDAVAAVNQQYMSTTGTDLINDAQIEREVVEQIMATLDDSKSRGALVVGPGGYGKSCVLAQCLSKLSDNGTPYLCLRMDSFQLCNTARQLGEQLDLPASPAVVLAGVADNAPSVLLVDQLDSMSLSSGRNPRMWEVFENLCDEAQSYPHMKMVLACRDFDLNHDYRLRKLVDPQSGFTKHPLGKLNEIDIQSSLDAAGYGQLDLNKRQLEILGVPFHLLLFLQGDPARTFTSTGELYDCYWDRKRQNLRERLGRDSHWNEVIEALTQKMSERQVLFAPKLVTDEWHDDAKAMASEHVLVEAQKQYRFFHESFFDYAYARRYCASGRSVVEFLKSTEQHLFRRAQVRQILAYRRENDFSLYISDIRDIFKSQKVRFHIKRMTASGLNRIDEPTWEEWSVVEPYLLDGDLSKFVFSAMRGHAGWFDLLDSQQVFEKWLTSNDARLNNTAILFFESPDLHDSRSARIAELIKPYAQGNDSDWRHRLLRIMRWGKPYKSPEMARIYLDLIASGAYDDHKRDKTADDFWGQHYKAEKEAPRFLIDVLATWFERAIAFFDDGVSTNILDKHHQNSSHIGAQLVGKVATKEPQYFVEKMLSRVAKTVLATEVNKGGDLCNRAWPYLSNLGDPFDIDDAILLFLKKSLQHLALHKPEAFRMHATAISQYPHQTFSYLLLQSWADNPEEFADECAEYIIADQRRFNIGYKGWFGGGEGTGESAISRNALRAISPYCSTELFKQMESRIIGYCDGYEKQTPRLRGYVELLLLRSLDKTRISKKAASRIGELERKFPDLTDKIVKEYKSAILDPVVSPIPQANTEIMADSHWISAMRKYDGRNNPIGGGPIELSRFLADIARRDRGRFASLVERMSDDINPMYFTAILDGLCSRGANLSQEEKNADQKELEATPTVMFLKVVDRLHALPGRPCGSAITGCIRALADRQFPAQVMDIVSYYATSDQDPNGDIWQQTAGGNKYYGGDPYTHGINCVRGQAAEAISSLLSSDNTRLGALRPALEALSRDPVVSVRTCAIDAFLPLLNFTRDLAIELFIKTCEGSEAICAAPPFECFVHYAIYTHYEQLREMLQFALKSNNAEAVEIAARQTILADLNDIDVGEDATNIRSGSEPMRKAAAEVYRRNISHDVVGERCVERLEEFFSDESETVQKEVGKSFYYLSGEQLLQWEELIARFIESKCFESNAYPLIDALEKSNVELPKIICRAAERILGSFSEAGTHIAWSNAMVDYEISTLVVRQYEQTTDDAIKTRCLDLIDRMERVGYLGISDELSKIDR